jgi:hypothetical protein
MPRIDALCEDHLPGNAHFSLCYGLKARSILKIAGSCIECCVGRLQLGSWMDGKELEIIIGFCEQMAM